MPFRNYLIFLVLFCFPFFVLGGENVMVSGFVVDSHNKAVELAKVSELDGQNTVYTDQKGFYSLTLPVKDTILIQYSCLSYKSTSRIIPVSSESIRINITLSSSDQTLKEVTVQGNNIRDNTFEHLDASRVKLLPDASGGSIEALLVTFAGVSSNNEMSSQYSVRGGNFDENLVYVNGTEIYRPLLIRAGQQEGLSFVNPEMVQDVHFSAGGFDAKYGDKMSSVLDITYKRPSRFESSVNTSLLGANIYVGQASGNGKFTQIHGFRYKTNEYLLGTLNTKAEYNPSFIDYQTNLNWKLSSNTEVSFLGNFSQNSYEFKPDHSETVFGTYNQKFTMSVDFDGKEKDLFRTLFGALTISKRFSKSFRTSWTSSIFNTVENENYDITSYYWLSETPIEGDQEELSNSNLLGSGKYHEHARNQLQATVLNFSQTLNWNAGNHTIESGLSFQREKIDDKLKEWEMRDSAGYSLPYSGSTSGISYAMKSRINMESNRIQGYVQDRWRFRTKFGMFALNAGIRLNYWTLNHELLFSPRGTLMFKPNSAKNLTFRLSGGVYYQAPFYKELRDTVTTNGLTQVFLNTHIKAQKTIQTVAGMDYQFIGLGRPFKLTTEIYYKSMSNLIPYTVDNVRIRYSGRNMANGYTAGIDAKLYGELLPGTDSWVSLSLLQSKETVGSKKISRPNESRYNFSLFFQDYFPSQPNLSLSLKLIVADGLPFGPPNKGREMATLRLPTYRRIDIGMSRLLAGSENKPLKSKALSSISKLWLGIDCFNLFNIRNTNSYYWISDMSNNQWGIPNYLTGRLLNFRISADFR
jgi:hypothetical protein